MGQSDALAGNGITRHNRLQCARLGWVLRHHLVGVLMCSTPLLAAVMAAACAYKRVLRLDDRDSE